MKEVLKHIATATTMMCDPQAKEEYEKLAKLSSRIYGDHVYRKLNLGQFLVLLGLLLHIAGKDIDKTKEKEMVQ